MRIVRNLIYFLLLFCICYYGMYYILFYVNKSDQPIVKYIQEKIVLGKDVFGKTIQEFDRNKKYDLIFIGSSHCYRNFDPKIFQEHNIDSYNLGSSSQAPINSYIILKSLINNTRCVALEVYPVASSLSGEESFMSMNASINNYPLLADMGIEMNALRCYNALSVKPFIDKYNIGKPYNINNSYLGYVSTLDSVKKNIDYEKIELDKGKIKIQLAYIKKIIQLCKQKNIPIYIVYAPVPKELIMKGENDFIAEINSLCKEDKIIFFDFGRNHSMNSRNHFFDDDHLNQAGVKLFNTELINKIKGIKNYSELGR